MKESVLVDIFWHAGFFLALSALVIPTLRYFKIPIALGYLLAGVILGPYALGTVVEHFPFLEMISLKDTQHVKILAELGIVLLLFVVGLEITPRRLWQMKNLVFGLGGAQVLTTAIVICVIAYSWGNDIKVSILLGLGLSLSSTAIVIQWLHEQKLFATQVGRSSFSILLFQDLAVVPILLLMSILSAEMEDNIYQFVSFALLKMCITVLFIYLVGKAILRPIFLFANRHGGAEVFMALCLLVIVVSASVASLAGLSMALGAFIAGLLLADTEYRHEISALIVPFKSMLLGIFFLSFGMSIDVHFIAEKPTWLFLSVVGLMCIKAFIVFALCKLWKQPNSVSAEAAILLSQAGEFGLLVVGGAMSVQLLDFEVGQFMLLTVGITMLLTPLLVPLARRAGEALESKSNQNEYGNVEFNEADGYVVVFGFGRVGMAIAEMLCKEGLRVISFEKDLTRVHAAQLKSTSVFYGDACKKSTIEAARLEKASCAVVTTDDPKNTYDIVCSIRKLHANIPIIVRALTDSDVNKFEEQANIEAVAEHKLISEELTKITLFYYGFDQADEIVAA